MPPELGERAYRRSDPIFCCAAFGNEDMWEDAKTETAPKTKKSQLFVIKQRGSDMFWNCSAEHGSGWNQGWPKQAWSKSELANEIRLMIERNFFQDCEILELKYNAA